MTREQLISMLPEGTENAVVTSILDALHAEIKPFKDAAKKSADDLAAKVAEIGEISKKAESAEEMTRKLTELQQKYDADVQAANDRAAAIEFDTMLDGILREKGARSIKAARAMLDIDKIKTSRNQKNDAVKAVEELSASEEGAFIFAAQPTGRNTGVGAPTGTNPGGMTREQIVAIKDPVERQIAIANNMHLFKKGD